MKRFLLLFLAVCALTAVSAQNANRKGFFIEAAVGGSIGDTPRTGLSRDGNTLMAHTTGGTVVNLAFGPRFRTGEHTAFDFRVEAQANTARITQTLVLKAMPGMRITTGELFGNMSLYISANVGFAVADSGEMGFDQSIPNDGTVAEGVIFDERVSFGAAYAIGAGLNITTHFYAGLLWDAQYMFKQVRIYEPENLHYGMVGVRVGYRF